VTPLLDGLAPLASDGAPSLRAVTTNNTAQRVAIFLGITADPPFTLPVRSTQPPDPPGPIVPYVRPNCPPYPAIRGRSVPSDYLGWGRAHSLEKFLDCVFSPVLRRNRVRAARQRSGADSGRPVWGTALLTKDLPQLGVHR